MKTKEAKILELLQEAANTINPTKKMGAQITVTCAGVSFTLDTRQYYTGRGAKYNRSDMHEYITQEYTQKALKELAAPLLKKRKAFEKFEALAKKNNYVNLRQRPQADDRSCIIGPLYSGCGKAWVAVKDGLIVALVPFGDCPHNFPFSKYRDTAKKKLSKFGAVVSVSLSGRQVFLNHPEDAQYFTNSEEIIVPGEDKLFKFTRVWC